MRDIKLKKSEEKTLNKFAKSFHIMVIEYIEEDKIYAVSFPDLPECVAKGETIKSALKNVKDAKWTWGAACIINGHSLPKPRNRRIDEQYVFVQLKDEERFKLNKRAWESKRSASVYTKSLILESINSFAKENQPYDIRLDWKIDNGKLVGRTRYGEQESGTPQIAFAG